MTLGEFRELTKNVPDAADLGIVLPSRHLFVAVRAVNTDPFPDRPAVLLYPAIPRDEEEERK